MKVLIITDIFGYSKSMDSLKELLEIKANEVEIVDPYDGMYKKFVDENEAYKSFQLVCGYEKFYILAQKVMKSFLPDFVIGFSAGAGVAWRLSSNSFRNCKGIVCFYPSQIRNYKKLEVIIPVYLFLPYFESTFDISILEKEIKNKKNVETSVLPYLHGFMNEKSNNYSDDGEKIGLELIEQIVN